MLKLNKNDDMANSVVGCVLDLSKSLSVVVVVVVVQTVHSNKANCANRW